MRARLVVKPTLRAAAEIQRASAWWRANREAAPFALAEDIERAFELVAAQPGIGARARNATKDGVRRLLLSRTGYHLYYQVNAHVIATGQKVVRGRPPALITKQPGPIRSFSGGRHRGRIIRADRVRRQHGQHGRRPTEGAIGDDCQPFHPHA